MARTKTTKDYSGQLIGVKRILRTARAADKAIDTLLDWKCVKCGRGGTSTLKSLRSLASRGVPNCMGCRQPPVPRPLTVGLASENLRYIGGAIGKKLPKGQTKQFVLCRCGDCGKEDYWAKGHVVAGIAACRCRTMTRGGLSATPVGLMWAAAKKRAAEKGVPFAITHDDIVIPEDCPVLGIKLERAVGKSVLHAASPTLDKIIPALGYVPGNIAVISWRANRIKADGTLEELEALVEWMRKQKGASRS